MASITVKGTTARATALTIREAEGREANAQERGAIEMFIGNLLVRGENVSGVIVNNKGWATRVTNKLGALKIAGHGVKAATPTDAVTVKAFQTLVTRLAAARVESAAEKSANEAAVIAHLTKNQGDFKGALALLGKAAKAVKAPVTVAETVNTLAEMPATAWTASDIRRMDNLLKIAKAAKATAKAKPAAKVGLKVA